MFWMPIPKYRPAIQPKMPPITEAKIVKIVNKNTFLGLAITHAASRGSIGIGKIIDSAKERPNKKWFVVLLDDISVILL